MKGKEQEPVIKDDAQPDSEGHEGENNDVPRGVEELQTLDELVGQRQNLPGPSGRKRLQKERGDTERLVLEEVEGKAKEEEDRGEGDARLAPKKEAGVGLGVDAKDRGIQRPGQKEDAEEEAHGEDVEDALDDDRPHDETLAHAFLFSEVEGLDDLAEAAGEDIGHGEADGVAREHVEETDAFLLVPQEEVPAGGPGEEVQGNKQNDQCEKEDVDAGQVAEDLLPIDAPQEKEEEDEAEEEHEAQPEGVLFHLWPPILS